MDFFGSEHFFNLIFGFCGSNIFVQRVLFYGLLGFLLSITNSSQSTFCKLAVSVSTKSWKFRFNKSYSFKFGFYGRKVLQRQKETFLGNNQFSLPYTKQTHSHCKNCNQSSGPLNSTPKPPKPPKLQSPTTKKYPFFPWCDCKHPELISRHYPRIP